MKIRPFVWAITLAAVSASSGMAWAQESGPEATGDQSTASQGAGSDKGNGQRLDFLSAEDRRHLLRVRRQALEANPDLKTEQESLRKERAYVQGKGAGASADDKTTLRNNAKAHRENMEAAMLKADPSVQPILDEVTAHMRTQFQAQAAGAGNGDGSDNP